MNDAPRRDTSTVLRWHMFSHAHEREAGILVSREDLWLGLGNSDRLAGLGGPDRLHRPLDRRSGLASARLRQAILRFLRIIRIGPSYLRVLAQGGASRLALG